MIKHLLLYYTTTVLITAIINLKFELHSRIYALNEALTLYSLIKAFI